MNPQRVRQLGQRLHVDRAVAYAVGARIWQLLTGNLTALLIVYCLTDIQQGYYYAFLSLLGMQIFVELGLHVVLINVASHEWAGLSSVDGVLTGDDRSISRLASLNQIARRWYLIAAAAFVIAVSAAGLWFFQDTGADAATSAATADWRAPWLTLVLLTGLQLGLLPMTSVLEGCGQLNTINPIRFKTGVIGSLVVWVMLFSGCGLWTLCGSAAVRLIGESWLVFGRYRPFFSALSTATVSERVNWRGEIAPLQWRIAWQGVLHWFATHLAGLVLFRVHGEVIGGQYGLMWTILTAMQGASLSWVDTRRPVFGRLIADEQYQQLDQRFFQVARISLLLMATGAAVFVGGVWVLNTFPNVVYDKIASRLPDLLPSAIFSVAFLALHPALCVNIYVRAFKRDPFMPVATVSSLTVAGLVYWLGTRYSIVGTGTGYLIGVGLVQTPLWLWTWQKSRREWQQPEVLSS